MLTVGAGLFHAEEQTDRHDELIFTVRNYADAPKNDLFRYSDVDCTFVAILNEHRLQSSPLSKLFDPAPK
jgi:hypothetical protein